MTVTQMAILVLVALIPSLIMFVLHGSDKARSSLGGRVGALEKRMDFEDGRRAGRAELRAESRGSDGK